MGFIEEQKLSCILMILNQFIDITLTQESNKDVPVVLHDSENYRNKTFLPLTVMQEEDKRREIKVPLPYVSSAYLSDKTGEQENMISLFNKKPFIVCHKISSSSTFSCSTIDISEDGGLICAGFEDSLLRLWNLQAGTNGYNCLIGHNGAVISVSISPEKLYIASSADDNEIRLWSLLSFSCVSVYSFHLAPIWVVKYSPTGHYFSSAAADGSVCLWSIEYTNPLKLFVGHVLDVLSVSFHPRGTYLASGSKDKTLRVWDTSTGDCVRIFCLHSAPVSAVCFSRNGRNLYSADEEGAVFAVDVNEKEIIWKKNAQDTVAAILVSQDNFVIACVMENSAVLLIDSAGETIKVCRVKKLNLFTGVFTVRNLLSVAGSFY
jgi:WD40 repeat protein